MQWQAKWIWIDDDSVSDINLTVLARKRFWIDQAVQADLLITADSRYRLYVNGSWVNDGPARGFPWNYAYDRIDISSYLKPGENIIAISVQHYGEGTFQSLVTRPGLLVQLVIRLGKRQTVIGTDHTWKMRVDPACQQWTPRFSCQKPCEEQYDARQAVGEWVNREYDDSDWPTARVVAAVETGPWKNLVPRDGSLLVRERVGPKRIVSLQTVRPPNFIKVINLKRAFWPEKNDANRREYRGAVLTGIESPCDQRVKMYCPRGGIDCIRQKLDIYLNGHPIEFDPSRKFTWIRLKKGTNDVFWVLDFINHFDDFQLILDARNPVTLKNPLGSGEWAVAGPYEPADHSWLCVKAIHSVNELTTQGLERQFRSAPGPACLDNDVHASTTNQEAVSGSPRVMNIENLLAENGESAVIEPCSNDIEITLDLGCEYNAYWEFELNASEGVIVDACCFEAYKDGQIHYDLRYRSGFRYVTRTGWQKYTTTKHFGARYISLTFRNIEKPILIKNISALFVHYPVEHKGLFECNDHLLNRIWEVGKQTLLCCMEDTFTDCPTYEQTYWVGDGRVEALICHTTFGGYDLTRRCVQLPAQSLKRSDLVECQVPSAWERVLTAWSLLWVQMAWEHFYFSGDEATLKAVYPAVRRMLETCLRKYLDERTGLLSIKAWNMYDWTGSDHEHDLVTHNNMFMAGALQTATRIARQLGRGSESIRWNAWRKELVARINRYLWSEKHHAYVDSIHHDGTPSESVSRPTNTLALLYEVADSRRTKQILPLVLGRRTNGVIPFGSPFALFNLMEYYVKIGRYDLLIELIRKEWGDMIDRGATTFWEMLGKTRSYCHAWSSAPCYFLSRYILGVHPLKPGFETVLISPATGNINFARGRMPTPHGTIGVEWRKIKSDYEISIEAPSVIRVKLQLPSHYRETRITINGKTKKIKGKS